MKNLFIRALALAVCISLISSCATYQANPRLEKTEDLYSMVQATLSNKKRSDELFFLLTFSGGGTRAAAMSYGILEALNKVP
jgi:NTE family protein